MIVWQDMPSADNKTDEGKAEFERELRAMIDARRNHPSIVMWVPFNEGWGQHDTEKYVSWLESYDPTRLVNNATGWNDMRVGNLVDMHAYPGPAMPPVEKARAAALGEFGGLGLPLEGHTWLDQGNWGYRSFTTLDAMNAAYRDLVTQLRLHAGDGLAAAIYTQTTDCEIEVNGVMTYDRAIVKLSPESIAANRRLYEKLPAVTHVVPASDRAPQTWRYTTFRPPDHWFDPAFDDAAWTTGTSGFGAPDTRFAHVGTPWQTPHIARPSIQSAGRLASPHCASFTMTMRGVRERDADRDTAGRNNGFQVRAADRCGARGAARGPEYDRRPRAPDPRRPVHRRRRRGRERSVTVTSATTRAPEALSLVRGLGLLAATAIVVGDVIGTGVFLKARVMTCNVGTPGLVIAVWVVGALLSLAGALTYAELAVLMPYAGGEYVFVREAYGSIWGFLYG